jgi:uncharacterized membrane protein YgdD (TMEM256/DUF423 family)
MYHALALVLTGLVMLPRQRFAWHLAAWTFLAGMLLFSGLLYVLSFLGTSWNWLGAVVPLGGLSLIVGWLALAAGALTLGRSVPESPRPGR